MTTQELLKEVLKDSLFQDKYHIPQSELQEVSFDTTSPYPIVEMVLLMLMCLKTLNKIILILLISYGIYY